MKLITCERCGKQELRHPTARFCLECTKKRRKYQPLYDERQCAYCGKKFTRTHPRQIYCSAECAAAANRINARLAYALRRKCAKK